MPVTRDRSHVETCAKVNKLNMKAGKAKDFGECNVIFNKIAQLDDIKTAEREILRALKTSRMTSPKGGKLEWLIGITFEDAMTIVLDTLDSLGVEYYS